MQRLVLIAAVLALLAAPTYAIARGLIDGWLSGEPAPQAVVANFGSHTPQLGFQPDSGRAVLVAEDGDVRLYATTNDRGSYCLATDTPDGGSCIPLAYVTEPLIAGVMTDGGAAPAKIWIAGRADSPGARTIRFSDPDGNVVTRPIGSSGFFVAAVPVRGSPCASGDWRPTFAALGASGEELATATITIASGLRSACGFAVGPHP